MADVEQESFTLGCLNCLRFLHFCTSPRCCDSKLWQPEKCERPWTSSWMCRKVGGSCNELSYLVFADLTLFVVSGVYPVVRAASFLPSKTIEAEESHALLLSWALPHNLLAPAKFRPFLATSKYS